MSTHTSWLPLLRKVFIFSTFTENHLTLLAKKMTLVSFPKGAVLFQENKPGDSLYLILSGSIRITKKNAVGKSNDDMERIVGYSARGDVMGEMCLLAGDLHSSTATVDSTAELLVLHKTDFDHLIEKYPALAVHLSRVLSNRLAEVDRARLVPHTPGKLFVFLPSLPLRDQIVFSINLAISMIQQTKRKVLLLTVNESPELVASSLGLEPTKISQTLIRDGHFEKIKKFDELVMVHPSGLELLSLSQKTFFDSLGKKVFPLLTMIQEHYDYCICMLPTEPNEITAMVANEANRLFTVSGPHSHPKNIDDIRKLSLSIAPNKKMEKIWLSVGQDVLPWDFKPKIKLQWNLEWGKMFNESGSPFIPSQDKIGQRMMDRLARNLAGLVIGLAMGSGAAFGYSLIGILRVLEREGIYPDVISGTSMGALIGSFYASGKNPDELESIARSITREWLIRMIMMDLTIPRSGLLKGNGILNFLREQLGDKTFQDLQIPFCCVATDIQTGKEIPMDEGNVAEAVRASLSLPFFFQPYYLNGRYLVDGGLVNPVPTSIIVSQGANILLSANLTSKTSDRKIPRVGWRKKLPPILRGPDIREIMMKTIYTMQYEIAAARSTLAHVIMQVNAPDLLWWDLDRAKDIIKIGELTAEESLPKIKSLLPYFSDSCQTHLSPRGLK